MLNTRKVRSSWLPATPVTEEERNEAIEVAREYGISLAELQRRAMKLFLLKIDSDSIKNDSCAVNYVSRECNEKEGTGA